MKKITVLFLIYFVLGCNFESPKEFSNEALVQDFKTIYGESIQLKEILTKHKGEKILLNVWASWCKDCLVAIPKMKKLQEEYPNITYVFISTDKSELRWRKALKKFQIKGNHYFLENEMDNDFGDFLNSNWIPRYLVINENGFVDLFKAKSIKDPRIVEALKK